jgi:hypothetical protein
MPSGATMRPSRPTDLSTFYREPGTMLYHIVLFQPKPDTDPLAWERLRADIEALPLKIAGITAVSWGANVSPEGIDQGYTQGFVMTFIDEAARDAYLPHPDHLAVIPTIQALSAQTLVYDMPVSVTP